MKSAIIQQPLHLPYEHLNLRFNPFGELHNEDRCLCRVVDCIDWISFLQKGDQAIQFVGKSRCGKTTYCLSLQLHFSDAEYYRVPCDGHILGSLNGDPVVLDELQFMSERKMTKLFRNLRRIIIGTHTNLHSQLVNIRFEVLTIYPEQRISVESLFLIVNKRIEFDRRAEGLLPLVSIRIDRQL